MIQSNIWMLIIFAGVTGLDLLFAFLSLKKHNAMGKSLGITCLGAAFVTASYLISVFVENYFLYAVLSSLYFIGIDVTLYALVHFVHYFTRRGGFFPMKLGGKLLTAYTVFDMVVLLVNPFREIAIKYVYEQAAAPHYGYQMMFLYHMHLLLAYIYIAVILSYFLTRLLAVPSVYRRQYYNAMEILLLVVLINAFYLYFQSFGGKTTLDYSLLGYSLAAFLFYWNSFVYSTEDMMNQLRSRIFASLSQGVLLFDYENELILENEKAGEMFAGTSWRDEPTIEELLKLLKGKTENAPGIEWDGGTEPRSFQCYPSVDQNIRPMRCDYSPLLSNRGEVLGRLFVFSDLSLEFDVLTGFRDWDAYKRQENTAGGEQERIPEIAVACDINGLTDINRELGHMRGDQAIQALAQRMRESFPAGTVFIRGREAILVAVCRGIDEQKVSEILEKMEECARQDVFAGKPLSFQSAMQCRQATDRSQDAVRGAMEMLRTRKLLDQNSRHSAVLFSLVQALKECDRDTEAHVRRTQKLGAKLGKRIGLTEEQQSNLALLAILHDIGKIGIPLDILNKPGKLNEAEWEVLKSHVEKGYQITSSTEELQGIAEMVLYHHERWDGKGYPDGLSKESIPLLSRIIAVVDAYDAMINDRSYRRAMPKEQAMQELRRCAGTQFDPTIVSEFLAILQNEEYGENGDVVVTDTGDVKQNCRTKWSSLADVAREETVGTEAGIADGEEELHPSQQWSLEAPESLNEKVPRIHVMRYSRYIVGANLHIIEADGQFEQMTGYSMEEVRTGQLTQTDLIFEEDLADYGRLVKEETQKNAAAYLEHRIRRKDGSPIFVFCYGRLFYDSAQRQERTEIIISDSSESYSVQTVVQMEQSKALRRLERWENKFRRDPLTGLLNHEAFKNDVETRLLAGQRQAMMLMMDVDHFKEYNDTWGHRAGDEFLIMVAQTLLGTLRKDDFACRMGGDEYAAILFFREDSTRERMMQRAMEICDKINLTLTSSKQGGASLSMGGAFLSESCNTFDRLYEAADQALYRSKESGRAKVSF